MHPFWRTIIAPVLDALEAATVLEIGAEQGRTTSLLLQRARERGGTVIAVDPQPRFDLSAWGLEWGNTLRFLRGRSLEVIDRLPPVDAALIDGDHNYFTVIRELEGLASAASNRGGSPPAFFIHDVGWPYGRRDLYYDPDSIPFEHRHSAARAAIHPDRADTGRPGVNGDLWNAIREGGPRNGVLTAVEDFLSANQGRFEAILIPGWHGLAILVPSELAERPAVREQLGRLESAGFLREWAAGLERARILAGMEAYDRGPPPEVREQIDRDQGLLD